jgi:multidrug resistance efflux pump
VTWGNRIRLALGLVLVLVLVAASTIVFNQRQHRAQSMTASIVAQSFPVGTDYGGIVVTQFVQSGDAVTSGQPLFAVRSLQLQRDLAAGNVDTLTAPDLAADGTSTIVATVDGTVSSIEVPQGGFAQAGGILATIDRSGSLFVEAEFMLTPRDYGRISAGSPVELRLPNQSDIAGTVTSIEVDTVDGQAMSTLRVDSSDLAAAASTGLFQPGTPVEATLLLRDDGPLAGVSDALGDLLRKVGL